MLPMKRFLSGIAAQFTPASLVADLLKAYVLSGLLKFAWRSFSSTPLGGWNYWIFVPLLIFGLLLSLDAASGANARAALRASIDRVNTGTFKPDAGGLTSASVHLVVSIRNVGAPSVAERFLLFVHFPSGSVAKGIGTTIPTEQVLNYSDGRLEVVWGSDDLSNRAMNPIPRGGAIRGRLLFLLPGYTDTQLMIPGVRFELRMLDGWGREYSCDISGVLAPTEAPMNYPGLMHQPEAKSKSDPTT